MSEKVVIYKDSFWGWNRIYAGRFVSHKKTYKIKRFESGHFDGCKTLVNENDFIALKMPSKELFDLMLESKKIQKEYDDKERELKENYNKIIEQIIEKIKDLEDNSVAK